MSASLRPATAGAPATAAPGASTVAAAAAPWWRTPLLQLVAFAAFAAFGAAHWDALVAGSSSDRMLLVVLVATAGAAVLALLGAPQAGALATRAFGGRPRAARAAIVSLAMVTGLATLVLGLGAAGLPLRLIGPENWSELFDGLDRGLAGVQGVEWPYDGPDEWIHLTVLMGAPFLLAVAATLAFFPARRAGPVLRVAALLVLLLLYGVPVTEQDPGAPLLRGLAVLVLVAGWLWLPRLGTREAGAGAAVVLAIGVISLPVAAALDGDRPWWDYRAWNWFGGGTAITFDWTHQYGPLDWPREGTTLLNIRSDRPHYWKAETLDGFDGFRWVRTNQNATDDPRSELPDGFGVRQGERWQLGEYNPRWDENIDVTVRSLTSDLIVSAGITHGVDGVNALLTSDGTARVRGEPLDEGDSYTVRSYAPDPSRAQMQGSSTWRYPGDYSQYTRIYLPNPGESATEGVGVEGDVLRSQALAARQAVNVPFRNDPFADHAAAAEQLRDSDYGRVYDLARDWTAGSATPYDAVKAIERRLQEDYLYAERVPTRPLPLAGFLFEDRRGYCQHFSGAMALMLRMVGIPARVAAGFSPGSFNRDSGEYRVRDLDAHSWVEVYFSGIGWVPFDPTPIRAPAQSQSSGLLATSAARADAGEVSNPRAGAAASERGLDPRGAPEDDGGAGWMLWALVLVVLLTGLGTAASVALRVRARRRLSAEELADAQLAELRRALARLDWEVPTTTTLLTLERRLGRAAGPAAARYAAGLRAHRYDPRAPGAPGAGERRALRRELSAQAGLAGRLRALLAIPPGGPRPA